MTSEEIERTIEIVVGNQARLTQEQIKLGARQARLDEIIKQVDTSHQALIERLRVQEERVDGHDKWLDAADEKLAAHINAQVKYEVRQERMEEALSQVAESHHIIVQLASAQGERLDGHDKADVQTESRLAALIDAQIQLSHNIAALNGCIDRIGVHLDQVAEQINSLVTAQTRTDEQIKILLDRDGAKKTERTTTKVAKKGGRSGQPRDSKSLANNLPGAEHGAVGGSS